MDKIKFLFTSIVPFFTDSSFIIRAGLIVWTILSIILLTFFLRYYLSRENDEISISIKYEKYTPEKQMLYLGLFNNKRLIDLEKKGMLQIEVKNNTKERILEGINFRIQSKFLIFDVARLYDEEDKSKQLLNYGKFKDSGSGTIGIVTSGADLKIDSLLPSSENKAQFYMLVEKINGTPKDDLDNAIQFDGWYKSNAEGRLIDKHFKRLVNISGL